MLQVVYFACEFLTYLKSLYFLVRLKTSSNEFFNIQIKWVLKSSLTEILAVYVPPGLIRQVCVCAVDTETSGSPLM